MPTCLPADTAAVAHAGTAWPAAPAAAAAPRRLVAVVLRSAESAGVTGAARRPVLRHETADRALPGWRRRRPCCRCQTRSQDATLPLVRHIPCSNRVCPANTNVQEHKHMDAGGQLEWWGGVSARRCTALYKTKNGRGGDTTHGSHHIIKLLYRQAHASAPGQVQAPTPPQAQHQTGTQCGRLDCARADRRLGKRPAKSKVIEVQGQGLRMTVQQHMYVHTCTLGE